jgi:hypothetical protein
MLTYILSGIIIFLLLAIAYAGYKLFSFLSKFKAFK